MAAKSPNSSRTRSPGILRGVLVFLAMESTAVASLGTPLLPTVEDAYHVSLSASQWTLTVTLLIGAVATPLMGRLGDGRLRRQTAIGAIATMLAGCVLSAIPAGFMTFMTGEMWHVMLTHSILGRLAVAPDPSSPGPGFARGVARGLGPGNLVHDVFGARTLAPAFAAML